MKKSRKITSLILAALIAVSASAVAVAPGFEVEAAGVISDNNYTEDVRYSVLSNGTVTITKYFGDTPNFVIPSIIDGHKVTKIEWGVFSGCTSLQSVTIPNGVTEVCNETFKDCTSLKSVKIPNSVKEIGWGAFSGCTSLKSVTIPNSVTSIGYSAFSSCESLTSVTIPNSVTSIGYSAFEGCTSLKSVTIPNSVTSISEGVFRSCTSLASITIPYGVTEIGNVAFRDCTSLASVTIPNSVTKIGGYYWYEGGTFAGCTSLKSVTIPNSVIEINERTFADCTSLQSVTLPGSITSIESQLFAGCTSLKSVTIPNGVKEINGAAFEDCTSLESITIPSSVTDFSYSWDYEYIFNNCPPNLTIYGVKGSAAWDFANEHSIKFVQLKNISTASVSLSKTSYTCTGKAIKPAVTVKYGSTTLKNGTDYTVFYKSNTNVGTATVTVTGKGIYTGTKTATFKIVAPKVAKPTNLKATQGTNTVKLTWRKASGADSYGIYVYNAKTGKYKGLATVTGTSYTVKNLKAGTTYKFAVRSNKKVGGATFHSSNAVGTVTTKFAKVKSLKATQSTSAVKLSWSRVSGATNYDVYQKIGGKWKRVATTKSTSYTVKKLKAGTCYEFAVRANKKVGRTTLNGQFAFITTATKTATPTMSVKAAGSRRATITWKKVSGATGYQIYMSTKKNSGYKKVATVSAKKTAKYTKANLKKGKTYYVRVRTYKVVGKAKIYSGYQTKTVKIK